MHNLKRLATRVVHTTLPERGWFISLRLLEGRWRAMGAKILRFAVCVRIALVVIMYLAPKAY